MSVILKAENISKQYRLGTVGDGTLNHDLKRWWYNVKGKEDSFLTVGGVNDRSAKATEDYIWALKDMNFQVNQGEILGIIGKNVINAAKTIGGYMGREPGFIKPTFNWENKLV